MNLISDLQYFPSIIYYKNSYKFTHIYFEQYDYYQKMSFRNRCVLAGANGPIHLSVPLEHGRDQKTLMKDIRVSKQVGWQKQHWRTILSCYNRSPWFEFIKGDLEELYRKSFIYLKDWNLACFDWVESIIRTNIPYSLTTQYQKSYDDNLCQDGRGTLLPKNYMNFAPIKYRQVFEERVGFLPNLSILDLLFCEGVQVAKLLD